MKSACGAEGCVSCLNLYVSSSLNVYVLNDLPQCTLHFFPADYRLIQRDNFINKTGCSLSDLNNKYTSWPCQWEDVRILRTSSKDNFSSQYVVGGPQ